MSKALSSVFGLPFAAHRLTEFFGEQLHVAGPHRFVTLNWPHPDGLGVLLRPVLGGGPMPAWPFTPGPVVPPANGTDISMLLLVSALAFAVIGFFRAFKPEGAALVINAITYFVVAFLWSPLAGWINRFYKLGVFAIVKRGIFVEDPTTVWKEMKDFQALIPTEAAKATLWQIAFLVFGALLAYGISSFLDRRRGPSGLWMKPIHPFLDRLLGTLPGAANGYLLGYGIISRIVPNAYTTLLNPTPALREMMLRYGPYLAMIAVLLLILYGIRSLGNKKPKVYA